MTYWPSEARNPASRATNWPTRLQAWPHYQKSVRRRVTDAPEKFADAHYADPMYKGIEAAVVVGDWVLAWEHDNQPAEGLLLMGLPGRGKTRLACAAANAVSDEGVATKFLTAPTLHKMSLNLMALERAKDEDATAYAELLEGYATAAAWPLLVLDDMGRERSTGSDYSEHLVEELLRNRYDEGAATIVTTNLDRQGIEDRYGARMSSLIEEMFWIVGLQGPDWRKQ